MGDAAGAHEIPIGVIQATRVAHTQRLQKCAFAWLVGAGFGFTVSVWLGIALLTSGVFVAFEALRGWCALRACGIKTKL